MRRHLCRPIRPSTNGSALGCCKSDSLNTTFLLRQRVDYDIVKIVAVIQVRMGSTRLPGKVLADVVGQPMLWHIVDRLRFAKLIDEVVLATSTETKDAPIRAFAAEQGIPCFAGSELDLVDRLYRTALQFGADAIVRITGDCPLTDPEIVDEVVGTYLTQARTIDYVSNVLPRTYPDGLDTEIYPTKTLE